MWDIRDSRLARRYDDTSFYASTRRLQQYNCTEERVRSLALTIYSSNMAKGTVLHDTVIDKDPWRPIPPDSVNRHRMELACEK
jgi:hypothetical protein